MIRALVVSAGLLGAGVLMGGAAVCGARPQSRDQTAASETSTAAKPKPKKIWTNDDMSEVTGTISVVGAATPQRAATPSRSASISSMRPGVGAGNTPGQNRATNATTDAAKNGDGSVDSKTLAQMKQQLQTLEASIEQTDKQIEQLKDASRGDSKNMGVLTKDLLAYSTASVLDQIKALAAKRSALQAAMDQLLDAARASGIEPGQLR